MILYGMRVPVAVWPVRLQTTIYVYFTLLYFSLHACRPTVLNTTAEKESRVYINTAKHFVVLFCGCNHVIMRALIMYATLRPAADSSCRRSHLSELQGLCNCRRVSVCLFVKTAVRQSQTADSAPAVATWEVTLSARKVVPYVRRPPTGITAHSL